MVACDRATDIRKMVEVAVGYLLGLVQGMRHALEPDHVAAVSTMVAEQRSLRSSVGFAIAWGAGHGLTLVVVGAALFLARGAMPARLSDLFELAVGAMLVGLGLRALVLAARTGVSGPLARHRHGSEEHVHQHSGDHLHVLRVKDWAFARRPLMVGLIHGLAGSGALTAIAMARFPSLFAGVGFVALYGVGAACGMAALAGAAGVPLARLARLPRAPSMLLALTGIFSIGLGAAWTWPLLGRLIG
jgi:hypothetical protein